MTGDTQDKLRALVLSALMVLSVFAGTIALSGAAAGASSNADNASATAPESAIISAVEYNYGASNGDGDIEIETSASVNLSSQLGNVSVFVNDQKKSLASINANIVKTDGYRHIITTNQSIQPTDTLELSIDGDDATRAEVTTTASTIEADTSNVDTLTAFKGGPIALNFTATDETYEVVDDDGNTVVGPLGTGTNSSIAVVQTDSLSTGVEYDVLADVSGDDFGDTKAANFTLRSLQFSVSADDVTEGSSNVSATVNSVANRQVEVVATDSDGNPVGLVGSGNTGSNGQLTVDLGALSAGDYTVTATDAGTGASVTDSVTVNPPTQTSIDFADNTVDVAQGDIAEITVDIDGTQTGYLVIGDETESGFQANVTLTDGNSDGQVTVEFNTFTTGRYGPEANIVSAAAAADGDSATLTSNTSLSSIIAQTDYSMGVSTDKDAAQEDPENIGTLFIGQRSTDQMQLWRTGSLSGVSTAEDVAAAVESGAITQTSTINPGAGDILIHQVDATGLEGLIANQSGGSTITTQKFISALGAGELTLDIRQTETNVPNTDPKRLNLSAVDSDALTVIPGEGTYYIALDTSADVLNRGDGAQTLGFERGENYEVTFTVPQGDLTDAENGESVGATFSTSEASSSLDQDTWSFESADNQSITGTSTYTSGTEVTVRIESDDPNNPLVDRQRVAVQGDGTFEAQFDLSALPEGTNVSIRLSDPSGTAATATGQVASAAAFEVSDLSAPSTAQIGDTATVTATVTNTGDLEGSTPVEFSIAGMTLDSVTQNVTLAGGESTTVEFNIPVTDELTPGQTYTHGVSAGDGEETAEITIEEQSTPTPTTAEPTTAEPTTAEPTTAEPTTAEPTTAEPTTAEPTTAEPTTAEPTTEEPTGTETMGDDGTTTEESGGGQPGFTMGVGIVALLAAALLALRRRN